MKLRTGLTIWIYFSSLIALAVSAGHLNLALELYSPLTATHLGPQAPMFTEEVIRAAPRYPLYLEAAGVVSLIAVLYFWRSQRPADTKTFAITLIAAVNLALAAVIPPLFYIGYFVIPKAANAV
jgi:hypothetical protein